MRKGPRSATCQKDQRLIKIEVSQIESGYCRDHKIVGMNNIVRISIPVFEKPAEISVEKSENKAKSCDVTEIT